MVNHAEFDRSPSNGMNAVVKVRGNARERRSWAPKSPSQAIFERERTYQCVPPLSSVCIVYTSC